MIELNTSKAGRHSLKPTLIETLNNKNLYPSNKEAFRNVNDSKNLLETRIRYINESSHKLSIINSNGFTIDIPGDNTWKNRLVIVVTLQWGQNCIVNASALKTHIPNVTEEQIIEILNNIKNNPFDYNTQELDFYYTVDLENIETDPYGIWIEDLNVQVIHNEFASRTTFFTRDAFYNINEKLVDNSELIYGTGVSLIYFTADSNIKESLFICLGNDSLEIKPIYYPGMKDGVYVNLIGDVRFSASKNNRKSLYIAPEDYILYGIYESPREFLERNKKRQSDKSQIDDMNKTFMRFHSEYGDDIKERLSVRETVLIGNMTIGDCFDMISELSKAENLLSKVFSRK